MKYMTKMRRERERGGEGGGGEGKKIWKCKIYSQGSWPHIPGAFCGQSHTCLALNLKFEI